MFLYFFILIVEIYACLLLQFLVSTYLIDVVFLKKGFI